MTARHASYESLTGTTIETSSFAKLNLRLKIIGRRPDGYHLLSMLNVQTDFCDRLSISFLAEPGVFLSLHSMAGDPSLADPARNLACRAAERMLRRAAVPLGVNINLEKRIPLGAGLGGGSSNAGTVLRLMQSALLRVGVPLKDEVLYDEANELGADVPYFLQRGLARVGGVGDEVRAVGAPVPSWPGLLFLPSIPLSTPRLYAQYRVAFPSISPTLDTELESFISATSAATSPQLWYERLLQLVSNDFEQILPDFCPAVWRQIELVRSCPDLVTGLTGSGSAFFALPRSLGADITALKSQVEQRLQGQAVGIRVISLQTHSSY